MPNTLFRLATALSATLVLTSACRSTPPAPAPTPAPAATDAAASAAPAPRPAAQAEVSTANPVAEDPALVARREAAAALANANVYFAYDDASLDDAARATLAGVRAALAAAPAIEIRVEGHTDERGSDEYNLALGQRRAAAVQRWLMGQGIAAARISIVSLGEERPAQAGGSEDAWSRNRRAAFVVVVGAP